MSPCLICNASTCISTFSRLRMRRPFGCVVKEIEVSSAEVVHRHYSGRTTYAAYPIKRVHGKHWSELHIKATQACIFTDLTMTAATAILQGRCMSQHSLDHLGFVLQAKLVLQGTIQIANEKLLIVTCG